MRKNQVQPFTNKTVRCSDCSVDFVLSAGEQYFYWSRDWGNPKRCPACRRLRKSLISHEEVR